MFEKMKGMMDQFGSLQKMMQNENFKTFISHPKIKELFQDPEFQALAKTRDFMKIMTHPKFALLLRDPEIAALVAKLNPKDFL